MFTSSISNPPLSLIHISASPKPDGAVMDEPLSGEKEGEESAHPPSKSDIAHKMDIINIRIFFDFVIN